MNISVARRVAWGATISLASAIVCAILALFVIRGTLSSAVGTTIAAAIVYMLPLMALQAATEKALRQWSDASRFPLDWIVYGGAKLTLGLVAAGIGSGLASLLRRGQHGQDLPVAERKVVGMAVIVACLILLYSTIHT